MNIRGLAVLLGILALVSCVIPNSVYAWADNDYLYRTPVDISVASGTTVSDYQVKVTVNTSQLYEEGKIMSDCRDFRFYNGTDDGKLPYYHNGCNISGEETDFWVRVDQNITTSDYTIYMYYGNSYATSESNGDAVFVFFDDFNDNSINGSKWSDMSNDNARIIEQNNRLEFQDDVDAHVVARIDIPKAPPFAMYYRRIYFGTTVRYSYSIFRWNLTMRASDGDVDVYGWRGVNVREPNLALYEMGHSGADWLNETPDDTTTSLWDDFKLTDDGYNITLYHTNATATTIITANSTNKNTQNYLGFGCSQGDTQIRCGIDDLLVTEYHYPEPTYSFDSEQMRSDTWYNENWAYRTPIQVSVSNGTTEENFQIHVFVNTTFLYDAGKLKSDCGDVRFADYDGNLLSHWEWDDVCDTSGGETEFVVKVADNVTSVNQTIFMYYGNSGASSTSSGLATMLFFDQFASDSLGNATKWTKGIQGNASVTHNSTGQNVRIEGGGVVAGKGSAGALQPELNGINNAWAKNIAIYWSSDEHFKVGSSRHMEFLIKNEATPRNNCLGTYYYQGYWNAQDDSLFGWYTNGCGLFDRWGNQLPSNWEVFWKSTHYKQDDGYWNRSFSYNNDAMGNYVLMGSDGHYNSTDLGYIVWSANCYNGCPVFVYYIDNVFIEKYHYPAPQILLGSEESPAFNTTVPAVKLNDLNFSFSSASYTTAYNVTFNTTAPVTTMLFVSSFNVKAETGNTTRDVYARVIIDGSTEIDQKVRTISGADDEGSTGIDPILFDVSTGEHYLQVDFRRTGTDSVNINDFDSVLMKVNSTDDNVIRYELTDVNYTHSSTSYVPAFNWSVDTYYFGKFSLSTDAVAGADVFYYFENLNTSASSPIWGRMLADENDTGSVSGIWLETNGAEYNHTIMSKTSAGNVTVTGSIIEFDTVTTDNKTINSFQTTNPSTDVDNYIALTEGTYNVANYIAHNYEGDSYFMASMVTLNASGESTPAIKVNSTQLSEANCYSKKERYMSDASDIGNAYIYTVCEGLSTGSDYEFNLYMIVPANTTVYLLDESFSGIEVSEFNITEGFVAPLPNSITAPSNGSYNKGTVSIQWLEFDDPNDDLSYYNITLLNSDSTYNQTINGSTTLLSQDFDTTAVDDGSYKVKVEAVDNQSLSSSTVIDIFIDNTAPVVTITEPQNATYTVDTVDDSAPLDLIISMSETVLQMDYSLNGESNITFERDASSFTGTIIVPEANNNSLMICGTDYAFNTGCDTVYFELVTITSTEQVLSDAGSGIGGFLSGLNQPLVDIILSLGFVGGILVLIYGLASTLKGFFGKVAMK
jgi:hypothetical protein